jgi:hypothetical protein
LLLALAYAHRRLSTCGWLASLPWPEGRTAGFGIEIGAAPVQGQGVWLQAGFSLVRQRFIRLAKQALLKAMR